MARSRSRLTALALTVSLVLPGCGTIFAVSSGWDFYRPFDGCKIDLTAPVAGLSYGGSALFLLLYLVTIPDLPLSFVADVILTPWSSGHALPGSNTPDAPPRTVDPWTPVAEEPTAGTATVPQNAAGEPGGHVFALAVSPRGDALAVTGHSGLVIAPLTSGTDLFESTACVKVHQSSGLAVAWSPDGERVVVLEPTGTRVVTRAGATAGHVRGSFESVAFLDESRVLRVARNGTVDLWDPASEEVSPISPALTEGSFSTVRLALSPARDRLALLATAYPHTSSPEALELAQERILDIPSHRVISSVPHPPISSCPEADVAFAPDGRTIAFADATVALVDATGKRRALGAAVRSLGATRVAFSPDGRTLAVGTWDGTVRLVDVGTGADVLLLKDSDPAPSLAPYEWLPRVSALAWSPDGSRLFAATGARVLGWNLGSTFGPK